MKRTVPILLLVFALNSCNKQESKSEANLKMTQLFFDNLFTKGESVLRLIRVFDI